MEKIKIVAIVRTSNGDNHYVLNRDINYTYTKIDRETIIGEDEGVLEFYKYDRLVLPFGKTAFGGRKFTLKLSDGTEEECHGQWWDAMSDAAYELFKGKVTYFPSATITDLKNCYVFYGRRCDKQWLEQLIAEYKGEIYDYHDYKNMLNHDN